MKELVDQLEATIADAKLSDDEKRNLSSALRAAEAPEEALRQLRNAAFLLARDRLATMEPLALVRWLEGVVRAIDVARAPAAPIAAAAHFSPGPGCRAAIVDCLRSAKRQIDICVFTLSDDLISDEVLAAHRRGVVLRLLTDNEKEFDRGSDIGRLRGAGVPVAVDRSSAHMHHKFAIFDQRTLLNGSYNWTRGASEVNEENIVITADAKLVRQFGVEFEALWNRWQGA